MRIEDQVGLAMLLDFLIGDPRWLPHPVRLIGTLAIRLESPLRRRVRNARLAGVAAVLLVVGSAAGSAWLLLHVAGGIAAMAHDIVSIVLLYTCFAGRDLAAHALAVGRALKKDDWSESRRRTSYMVGRDTAELDEQGIVRAVVESVAENTVDGVTAPLFFALLGGPVAAIAYKAASTLDSTFGYKNERYLYFGWASAKLDDVLAWLPARLTLPLMTLASALLGLRPLAALRCGIRDGQKHASPNSGISEAAAAGALGVRLGGPLYRKGLLCATRYIGNDQAPLQRKHIGQVTALMVVTAVCFFASGWAIRHFAHL
jgi:adenosylcobinamide-phosphate synthase